MSEEKKQSIEKVHGRRSTHGFSQLENQIMDLQRQQTKQLRDKRFGSQNPEQLQQDLKRLRNKKSSASIQLAPGLDQLTKKESDAGVSNLTSSHESSYFTDNELARKNPNADFRTRDNLGGTVQTEENLLGRRDTEIVQNEDSLADTHSKQKGEQNSEENKAERKWNVCSPCKYFQRRYNKWLDKLFDEKVIVEELEDYSYDATTSDEDHYIDHAVKPYNELTEREKHERLYLFYNKLYAKLKGAIIVIHAFKNLQRQMYLTGSKKIMEVIKKNNTLDKPKWFIIMPTKLYRKIWSAITHFCILYTAIYVPFKVAFIDVDAKLPFFDNVDHVVDYTFIADMFINFFTAYEISTNQFEYRLGKIISNYLKGWFVIDLVACFPFEQLQGVIMPTDQEGRTDEELAQLTELPQIFRLLRLIRLFRLLKFSKSLNNIFRMLHINVGIGKLTTVLVTVFFIVHFVACVWYWSAEFEGFNPNVWVVRKGLIDSPTQDKYITAVYWAFQTLTTVGYGDVPAVTDTEKLVAIVWMVFGVGFYSYTIGNFQTILNEIDVKSHALQQMLDTLLKFSQRTGLPETIQREIARYINNNSFPEEIIQGNVLEILEELPIALKGEIAKEAYEDIVSQVKFFQDKPPAFLWRFMTKLKHMRFYFGQYLFSQGEHAEELYFIQVGKVKLLYDLMEGEADPFPIPFRQYCEGSYFGDSDVLADDNNEGRDGTALVDAKSTIFVMQRKDLLGVLKYYKKTCAKEMIKIAKERRINHKEAIIELKQENQYIKKKLIKAYKQSLGAGRKSAKEASTQKKKMDKQKRLLQKKSSGANEGTSTAQNWDDSSSSEDGKQIIDIDALTQEVQTEKNKPPEEIKEESLDDSIENEVNRSRELKLKQLKVLNKRQQKTAKKNSSSEEKTSESETESPEGTISSPDDKSPSLSRVTRSRQASKKSLVSHKSKQTLSSYSGGANNKQVRIIKKSTIDVEANFQKMMTSVRLVMQRTNECLKHSELYRKSKSNSEQTISKCLATKDNIDQNLTKMEDSIAKIMAAI